MAFMFDIEMDMAFKSNKNDGSNWVCNAPESFSEKSTLLAYSVWLKFGWYYTDSKP